MNNILTFSIAFMFYTGVYGQYSYISISDSCSFNQKNAVFFGEDQTSEYITSFINGSGYAHVNSFEEDFSKASQFFNIENYSRRRDFEKHPYSFLLLNSAIETSDYGFQIYPVSKIDCSDEVCYFIVIIEKEIFPNWQEESMHVHDGGNSYYHFGVCRGYSD